MAFERSKKKDNKTKKQTAVKREYSKVFSFARYFHKNLEREAGETDDIPPLTAWKYQTG
jgi:hypothetical protein